MTRNKSFKYLSIIVMGIGLILSIFTFNNSLNAKGPVSPLEGLMLIFFTTVGGLILWASTYMIDHDIKEERIPLYYGISLILIGLLCGIVLTDNLIVNFILIEISAFLAAGIVMIKDGEENYKAGLKYLMLSIFASAFLLVGIIILKDLSGTYDINRMRMNLMAISNLNPLKLSFVFILIGVGFKSALFPFHIWLPDAHGSAPAPSSAILSSLVLKAYIIFLIKLIYTGYGIGTIKLLNILNVLLILGCAAMIYGSLMAIMQTKLKKMIAYSSIAQIGYIFLGLGLGNALGLVAAIFHIIVHGVTKACLFLNAGTIIMATGKKDIKDMDGLGRGLPITMALFSICGLSMIGIPLLAGFSSKWNFGLAIMDSNRYWVIIILSLSSLLNALYYLPISIKSYFSLKDIRVEKMEVNPLKNLPVIVLGLMVILMGIFSNPIINLISQIVEKL